MKLKEDENGLWQWIDSGHGSGFWARVEDEEMTRERIPLSCPACNTLLYNWDDQFFYRHGVCANCSINWIEDRKWENGFFKSNKDKVNYVKQKIAEKLDKK